MWQMPLHAKRGDEGSLERTETIASSNRRADGRGQNYVLRGPFERSLSYPDPPDFAPAPALREQRSFAVEDLVVDTALLESARDAGYATKVVFISTEDPNLMSGAS
jgi:hypothetical protein